jgi:hypothetical protein
MKIDYYTLGDPTDPAAWSGTYLELTTALENLGVLQGAYNIRPPWLTSIKPGDKLIEKIVFILKNMKYFKYYERKIYLASEYYPDVVDSMVPKKPSPLPKPIPPNLWRLPSSRLP